MRTIFAEYNPQCNSIDVYTVLYNFLALVFSLIRVRKLIWEDITQGKQ